jgi:hypothetical protein
VDALQNAAGVYDTQFLEVPVNAPIASCKILIEGYRDQQVVFNGRSPGSGTSSIESNPPQMVKLVTVCVCLRADGPPEIKILEDTQRMRRVPGTGSTRLGYSFTMIEENGKSGTGGHTVVPHADFDFQEMRGAMKCEIAAFTIVDRHHETPAVPLLVYFPKKFDVTSLKGEVDALNLPDGSVVVYAAIEKVPYYQEARVVRAVFETNKLTWTICINQNGGTNVIRNANFTNELNKLNLRHGDILLVNGWSRFRAGSVPSDTWNWFQRYNSATNRVTVLPDTELPDSWLLNAPIYHCLTPYDRPLAFDETSFFFQGKLLGTGMTGYRAMLADIGAKRFNQVYIVGSLHTRRGSQPPNMPPYENHRDMLRKALVENGTVAREIFSWW